MALGALLLGAPVAALAQTVPPAAPCNTVAGATVTCTGNVSAGVSIPRFPYLPTPQQPPYHVLNVDNVTTGITPANGTNGIDFRRWEGDVTVNADLSGASHVGTISVSGTNTFGILALSYNGDTSGGFVTVNSIANIIATGEHINQTNTNGHGISAEGFAGVSVTSTGNIQAVETGIVASSASGNVTVRSYGDISSPDPNPVYASASGITAVGKDVDVKSVGNMLLSEGITANGSGKVNVSSDGNIMATQGKGEGIVVSAGDALHSSLTSTGNISANYTAISAYFVDSVITTGTIIGETRIGINAGGARPTVISNKGTSGQYQVIGATYGIRVVGGGGASLDSTGDVTSLSGTGIYVMTSGGADGPLSITSTGGEITARNAGIAAKAGSSEKVEIVNTSGIVTQKGDGISVGQLAQEGTKSEPVSVSNGGAIASYADGISVVAQRNTTITNTGAITSAHGAAVSGISRRPDGSAAVTIVNDGVLTAAESGISGQSDGAVNIDNTAAVTAATAIDGKSDAALIITNAAALTANNLGISATGDTVAITNDAAIAGGLVGIAATGRSLTIANTGTLSALGAGQRYAIGIRAKGYGNNDTDVTQVTNGVAGQSGRIDARRIGIDAEDLRAGSVSVTNSQDIHAGIGPGVTGGAAILAKAVSGDVTVDSTGQLTADTSTAIVAQANGAGEVHVTNGGEISAQFSGISATSASGNLKVDNSSAIGAATGSGIFTASVTGGITVTNSGHITSRYTGLAAQTGTFSNHSGEVTSIANYGAIDSGFDGINVFADSDALTTVTNGKGDGASHISTVWRGIYARATDSLVVTNRDAVSTTRGYAIDAIVDTGSDGTLSVTSSGQLAAFAGINARNRSSGDVTVINSAAVDVTSRGIAGYGRGAVLVDNRGAVTAGYGVISYAWSGSGGATLLNSGNVTSRTNALEAKSRYGGTGAKGAIVTNSASLVAGRDGINVAVTQSGDAKISSSGGIRAGYSGIAVDLHLSAGNSDQIRIDAMGDIHAGMAVPDPYSGYSPSGWHGIGTHSDSTGLTSITTTGRVTSDTASGIYAHNTDAGNILVTSGGAVGSYGAGIWAFSAHGSVEVKSGAVTSGTQSAILTGSIDNDLAVTANGLTVGATGHAAAQLGFTFSQSYYKYNGTDYYLVTIDTLMDGRNNHLTIGATGDLRNAGGIGELAVLGGAANEAVSNAGIVTGNVDLGGGANSFDNQLGGRFNMGTSVKIGAGNALTNAGTLSMGGSGTVMSTSLTGDLLLTGTSLLDYDLGAADAPGGPLNDLLTVSGKLTLGGGVKVKESPGGSFGIGVYRLIDYAGSFIDNGLSILGALPHNLSGVIQTSIAGQVNLIVSDAPVDVGYWDGPNETPGNVPGGRGGTSVWDATRTNWTTPSGNANGPWDSDVGVFGGATGTVTVEGRQAFTGLQFVADDYHLVAGAGGALDLRDGGFIYVDQDLDTSIAVAIDGDGQLLKQGAGRLILSGINGQHGTAIQAGTLGAAGNQSLGSGTTSIANAATLQAAAADVTLANAISVAGVSTVDSQGYGFTLTGKIGGDGKLRKTGLGTLVLTGLNDFSGGTDITRGTVSVGANTALGSGTAAIFDGTTLQAHGDGVTLANAISVAGVSTVDSQAYGFTLTGKLGGGGELRKTGTGTLVLGGDGSLIGGLDIAAGRLSNTGALGVAGAATMEQNTVLTNAAGATMAVRDGITGDSGMQAIDNAGLLAAVIDLGQGDDSYRLAASGTQFGAVSGGAGIDRLALNAGPTGRVVGEDDCVNFETLVLNGDGGASGRFVLAGAAAPETRATLDLGTSGTARLAAGELKLALANSSLRAGRVSTASDTRLTGNGTVYGDLAMAGTIAPGNDGMGRLTVDGDYEQTGTYDVEISHEPGGAPRLAASDRIVATGTVSFGGTVDVSVAEGSSLAAIKSAAAQQGAMRWRILDGNTPIAPDQRTARLVQPTGLDAALDYANGGEDVDLFLAWAAPGRVPEQAGLLWQMALQPDLALCDGTDAGASRKSCAFLQGSTLSVDDDEGHGGSATGWSGVAGGGGAVGDDLWLGFGAGYRAGDLDGGDYGRLAAYLWGSWQPGRAELKGFAGLGHYDIDGHRGTTSGATAAWDYGAWQPFVAAEGRYWMDLSESVSVTPVAGLTSVWLALPSHGESGAGFEDFRTDAENLWGMTTLLGGEARWQAAADLTFEATAGWQHLFGDDAVQVTGTYAGIPGANLSASSDAVDRDQAAMGLGVLMPVGDSALLCLDYDATASADQFTQSGTARFTVSW